MPIDSSIYANLQLQRAPITEPVTLEEAEGWARIASDGGPIDQDFFALITFARQQCETILRRALYTQMWKLSLKNWPGRDYQNWPQGVSLGYESYYKHDHIELPLPPLQGVASVTYLDTSANSNIMPQMNASGGYNVDLNFEPGRIVLPFSQIWPTTILLPGAPISAVYVGGYQDGTGIGALTLGGTQVGYQVGDVLVVIQSSASPNGGTMVGFGGLITVTAVSLGAITGYTFTGGAGYAIASGLATSGGSGTGATVNITALAPEALSTQFEGWSAVKQSIKTIIMYCFENKIPPSEMRRSSIDAGLEYVIRQFLTPYRIH